MLFICDFLLRSLLWRFTLPAFLVLWAIPATLAQQSAISGLTTDQSGALVTGAAVTLTNDLTGAVRTASSNDSGIYSLPFVTPGRYTLAVEATGFKRSEQQGIVVETGQALSIGVRLEVGDTKETVTIDGSRVLLNTTDAAVSTIVDREFVGNVPLNGRTLQSLMTTVPGVVAVPSAGTNIGGGISVNGQRTEANYFTVDGLSANSGASAQEVAGFGAGHSGSLPATTALGTTQSIVSLDALEEFRALTSTYSAEYGRTPGGQFTLTTRSGTNDFHGSLYNYLRNDKLNANNWFNNQAGLPRNIERQNDFGGTFGGPVFVPGVYSGKDRTFFFFSYEGMRLRLPQAAVVTGVPTVQLRNSAPAAIQPFLNAFPLPNGVEVAEGIADFRAGYSAPASINATGVRLDHSLRNNIKLFGRYNDTPSSSLTRSSSNLAVINDVTSLVRTGMGGVTATLTPRITFDARANGTWNDGAAKAYMDNLGGATPLRLEDVPGLGSKSEVQFGFIWGTYPRLTLDPRATMQRQVNATAALAAVTGRHMLKIGVDYRRTNAGATRPTVGEYAYYFTPDEIRQNAPGQSLNATTFSLSRGGGDAQQIYRNFSAYVQDEWQVRQRLSLSLGLRWDVNPAPTSVGQARLRTLDQIDNLTTAQLMPEGTPLWNTRYANIAPRFGLAFRLRNTAGHETVLRAGGGIFYDTGNTQAGGGYYFGTSERYDIKGLSFPVPAATIPTLPINRTDSVYAFDPNLKLPLAWHWNVSVEQALGTRQTIKVGYVASAATRLLRFALYDALNTGFGSIGVTTNEGRSDYNSLQVEYQHRMSHGLQVLGSYTLAHSLDNASSGLNRIELPLQRANSDFDIRQSAQLALSYQLPGRWAATRNWSISARVSARTALPLDITSTEAVADPTSGLRARFHPNVVAGEPLYLSDPNVPGGRRVNYAAFQAAPAGVEGNLGRNALRAFNSVQADLALQRNFRLAERLVFQFRAEAFNAFNRANFGTIYDKLSNGPTLFGIAQNTLNSQLGGLNPLYQLGGPRSMQLALKLQF